MPGFSNNFLWLGCLLPLMGAADQGLEQVSDASAGIVMEALPVRQSKDVSTPLFRLIDPQESGVDFDVNLPDMVDYAHELLHLSVMGGICSADFDGDGRIDFYITRPQGGNQLFRNKGGFKFENVTAISGLQDPHFWGTGAVFVDIDNDGDQDLFAAGYRVANRLWINHGPNSEGVIQFVDEAAERGLDFVGGSMCMVFADYDLDGDLDGYLVTTAVPPPPGIDFRVRFEGDKPVIPEELREYWALIYLPGDRAHRTEAGQFDRLYRNDDGQFVDVTSEAGIDGPYFTLGALWLDMNQDGWPDLYVANDYLGPDMLYLNNKDGTFTDVIRDIVPHTPWSSMGLDLGDINNDGRIDWMTTDMLGRSHYRRNVMLGQASQMAWFREISHPPQYVRNGLYLNMGEGAVLEVAHQLGLGATDWTWGPRIDDFDEDGFLDVFITNGMIRDVQHADLGNYADSQFGGGSQEWAQFWSKQPPLKETNLAFRNKGGWDFDEEGEAWGLNHRGVSMGSTTADLDGDGDQDLLVYNIDGPMGIYENQAADNHRILVHLEGTRSNRSGLGASVHLTEGGRLQTRYLTVNRGWLSGTPAILHFGLGQSQRVDTLTVQWPGGGVDTWKDLPADHRFILTETGGLEKTSTRSSLETPKLPLFQLSQKNDLPKQELSAYNDWVRQPLLSSRRSQSISAWAWGDVDADGDDDLFLGGVEDSVGRLFLQGSEGGFFEQDLDLFQEAKSATDTDAHFFDVDGDRDLDLFVVAGGNNPAQPGHTFVSRLYLNDGKGGFRSAHEAFFKSRSDAGSCVAASHYNPDSGCWVFIGGGSLPGRYPLSAPSRLIRFHNNKIEDVTPPVFEGMGLIVDAAFGDMNGDGEPDLVVAEDWGAIRIFLNKKGDFVEEGVAVGHYTGRWRSLALADIDLDGSLDILIGNLGRNHRHRATATSPQRIYYSSEGSGSGLVLIEAYFESGQWYPHKGFDELSRVFPHLRGKFANFHSFSIAPLSSLFDALNIHSVTYLEVNHTDSGVFMNRQSAGYKFRAFPEWAQVSPVNDIAVGDVNQDGHLDIVLAQNDFSLHPLTGRMDGGLSLVMLGDGAGGWVPLTPGESGLAIRKVVRHASFFRRGPSARPSLAMDIEGENIRVFEPDTDRQSW